MVLLLNEGYSCEVLAAKYVGIDGFEEECE